MGTNISGWVEVKVWKNQKDWLSYHEIPWHRDYRVYAMLANVRNENLKIPFISNPKGLPKDIHAGTKYEYDEEVKNGVKWESWVTAGELYSYLFDNPDFLIQHKDETKSVAPMWVAFIHYILELGKLYGMDNVRIVIWFNP